MQKLSILIGQKFIPTLTLLFFIGTSLATSVVAGNKLWSNYRQAQVAQAQTAQTQPSETNGDDDGGLTAGIPEPTETVATADVAMGTTGTNEALLPVVTIRPTPTPTSMQKLQFPDATTQTTTTQTSTTGNNTQTNGCIVTLFGQQFDVTSLRRTHSGGDIFVCGTDMTSVYQRQHGTDLSRMAPYKVSGSTNSTTTTSGTTTVSTNTNSQGSSYDDGEGEEERARYIDSNEDQEHEIHQESQEAEELETSEH